MRFRLSHPDEGVANGTRKIKGLGNFCSGLEISEAISMSLEISFSCVSLRLEFSNFWPRGLAVSDFCLLTDDFDQNYDKIVYLIKNVR